MGDAELPEVPEEDEVDERNETTEDDERIFLKDLGINPDEVPEEKERDKPITDWEGRSVNPLNKPLHPSVTEEYFTPGGKQVRAVHDEMGTFWHVEFVGGGQVPEELSGRYTDEDSCRQAIKIYLAKKQ